MKILRLMMCYFARRKLQPMFEDALSAGYVQQTDQEVLDSIPWENMVKVRDEMHEDIDHSPVLH